MSDTSQGPGWWLASDGKWYPPQQAPASAPPPREKKPLVRRVWFWLLIVFVGFIVFIVLIIVIVSAASKAVVDANNKQHTVVYTVTGSGVADITYDTFSNGNSGTSQLTNQTLPWSKTVTGSGLFSVYSVSGTLTSGSSVNCTITVDGKVQSSHSSTGQFATADCTAGS